MRKRVTVKDSEIEGHLRELRERDCCYCLVKRKRKLVGAKRMRVIVHTFWSPSDSERDDYNNGVRVATIVHVEDLLYINVKGKF